MTKKAEAEVDRDMTSGRRNFRRNLVDTHNEKNTNRLLKTNNLKRMDLDEIEEVWDELD